MPNRPPPSHLKGGAFRGFLLWYAEHHDDAPLKAWLTSLPFEERHGLDPEAPAFGAITSTWYPSEIVHPLLDRIQLAHPPRALEALLDQATEEVVNKMLRGVYGMLFELVATPKRYASNIQRAWNQLHDTGQRELTIVAPGEALSVTREWAGHHPLICRMTVCTMAALFRHMGCAEVEAERLACVDQGADACRARIRWNP